VDRRNAQELDWTGLVSVPEKYTPVQHNNVPCRPSTDISKKRPQGLETKLDKGSNIRLFLEQLRQKLKEHGMDTIAYLPSPIG
jgi:hypothetical protein